MSRYDELKCELDKVKDMIVVLESELESVKAEEEQKYCLNVFTEMPKENEPFYIVANEGVICASEYESVDSARYIYCEKCFENTILFKDQKSAETYKELRSDMKRLSKEFKYDEKNYFFFYDDRGIAVEIDYLYSNNYGCHYYTKDNAEYLLDKYGQEVLKNYILYCKQV